MEKEDSGILPAKFFLCVLRFFILCFCNIYLLFVRNDDMSKPAFPGLAPDSAVSRFFRHPPCLATRRLTLRPLRMEDARSLYAWTSDAEVARYVLWDAHRSLRETREYIRYVRRLYRSRLPSSWGILLRDSDDVIGTIGIMTWVPVNRTCEIGYSLSREHWGKGLMTEAVAAFSRMLFSSLPLNRIEAQHDVRNPASGRVLEKCGFRREGLLRSRVINKEEPVDVVLWAILSGDLPPKS